MPRDIPSSTANSGLQTHTLRRLGQKNVDRMEIAFEGKVFQPKMLPPLGGAGMGLIPNLQADINEA
jgi:hypothetical protein